MERRIFFVKLVKRNRMRSISPIFINFYKKYFVLFSEFSKYSKSIVTNADEQNLISATQVRCNSFLNSRNQFVKAHLRVDCDMNIETAEMYNSLQYFSNCKCLLLKGSFTVLVMTV